MDHSPHRSLQLRTTLLVLFLTALAVNAPLAQVAVVTQPVHLQADASTNHPVLRLLYPPARLQLIPPKELGDFYHVRTDTDDAGWVWKRNVSVYIRDDWMRHGQWIDADHDCQTTRHEVLIAESTTAVTLNPQGCTIIVRTWQDPYSGETFTDPGDLDTDHMVPLAHAHLSGGWAWERERREAYANDLAHAEHLLAVKLQLNRQKGDKSPDEWKPPRQACRCEYATAWLAVKQRWHLTLTADEASAIAEMLRTCP
jgi:hypothetical protein